MPAEEAEDLFAGVIVDGKVVLEDNGLPEGTRVAVKILDANDDDDSFHVTADEKVELLKRIAAIRRGEYVDGRAHLEQLLNGG